MKPYETASGRAAALYRLATAPKPERTLQICCGREALPLPNTKGSASHALDGQSAKHSRHSLPFVANSFERIVLHRTLDDLQDKARKQHGAFDAATFMAFLTTLLVPGGVIAGCVQNRSSPRHAWNRLKACWSKLEPPPPANFTPGACLRLLRGAALSESRVFSLLPNSDSPLRLIDLDPFVSKFCFRHELNARRELSLPAYALRRLVVELGLYPYLEDSIFFWGYKPC